MINKLKRCEKLCVFYVATIREFTSGELEQSIYHYLNSFPSQTYSIDLYIYFNKLVLSTRIEKFHQSIKKHININDVKIVDLNLTFEEDTFWYPWLSSPKPFSMPKLGYTAGANNLFFRSLDLMFKEGYEYNLMLESDTFPCQHLWFDRILSFSESHDFDIAGSRYKGMTESHYLSFYKEHLNGVAVYKNSPKMKKLSKNVERFIKKNMPDTGYYNFDIAINDYNKEKSEYSLIDTDFIINISDPRDKFITTKSVIKAYPNAMIIHQKEVSPYRQLNLNFFNKNKNFKEIMVFYAMPKSGSEFCIKAQEKYLINHCNKTGRFPFIISFATEKNSRFYLLSSLENPEPFDRKMFQSKVGNFYSIAQEDFQKISESDFLEPFSIVLDQRYSTDYDYLFFMEFHQICYSLKLSPSIFSFLKNPLDIASSLYIPYANANRISVRSPEFKLKFHDFLVNYSPKGFLSKNLIGKESLNAKELDFLYSILWNFSFYDVRLIETVLKSIFQKNKKIDAGRVELKSIPINHTVNKINFYQGSVDKDIEIQIENKYKQDLEIYNKIVVKNIAEEKVPFFIHQPKCGGSFVNSVFTYYFESFVNDSPELSNRAYRRINVNLDKNSIAIFYCYVYEENFFSDPDVSGSKKNPFFAQCSEKTFLRYFDHSSFLIFAASTSLSGYPKISYEFVKKIANDSGVMLSPFSFLRDPRAQMSSLLYSSGNQIEKLKDAWPLRALYDESLSGIKNNIEYVKDVVDFFIEENIYVRDLSFAKEALGQILFECYGLEVPPKIFKKSNLNSNPKLSKLEQKFSRAITANIKWNTKFYNEIIY
jgi:hypothetical protein